LSVTLVRIPIQYLLQSFCPSVLSVRTLHLKNVGGIFMKFCFEKFYENIDILAFIDILQV